MQFEVQYPRGEPDMQQPDATESAASGTHDRRHVLRNKGPTARSIPENREQANKTRRTVIVASRPADGDLKTAIRPDHRKVDRAWARWTGQGSASAPCDEVQAYVARRGVGLRSSYAPSPATAWTGGKALMGTLVAILRVTCVIYPCKVHGYIPRVPDRAHT